MNKTHKPKATYFISLTLMITILIGIAYGAFLRKIEVDCMSGAQYEYSGESGKATLSIYNSSQNINQRTETFMESIRYEVEPNEGLSNGDIVHVTAVYDESIAEQYNFQPINVEVDIEVSGLPDQYKSVQEIEPEYLNNVYEESEQYVTNHATEIFDYKIQRVDAHPELEEQETVYRAFLKSNRSGISDRILSIQKLTYSSRGNTYTFYYSVFVPGINTSKDIVLQDIYGEIASVTDDEINGSLYDHYVSRVYGVRYVIEPIEIK